MDVITIKNVFKSIGKREIIKDISFEVKEGEVFGFLGKNGAGKTTTIRMMTGLITADRGDIKIMGHEVRTCLEKALERVGVVVENPEFYPGLTGRENLICAARMYGNVPHDRIEDIIEMIGLKERIDDKVKKYSLGMKQRLGLGQALLCNPRVLIMDEPTNGLDPLGIVVCRNIIQKVSRENRTAVFISSHLLSEIQQVCDRVAIIDNGRILAIEKMDTVNENGESKRMALEKRFLELVGGEEKCGA
jgi:ABC-2 type transport system ATP-binding protein